MTNYIRSSILKASILSIVIIGGGIGISLIVPEVFNQDPFNDVPIIDLENWLLSINESNLDPLYFIIDISTPFNSSLTLLNNNIYEIAVFYNNSHYINYFRSIEDFGVYGKDNFSRDERFGTSIISNQSISTIVNGMKQTFDKIDTYETIKFEEVPLTGMGWTPTDKSDSSYYKFKWDKELNTENTYWKIIINYLTSEGILINFEMYDYGLIITLSYLLYEYKLEGSNSDIKYGDEIFTNELEFEYAQEFYQIDDNSDGQVIWYDTAPQYFYYITWESYLSGLDFPFLNALNSTL